MSKENGLKDCRGCGWCCLNMYCAFKGDKGPCDLLQWDAEAGHYRCKLVGNPGDDYDSMLSVGLGCPFDTPWYNDVREREIPPSVK